MKGAPIREYHCVNDLLDLSEEDPVLWREMYGYMQVCLYEDDEVDLRFLMATEEDLPAIQALGTPEETGILAVSREDAQKGSEQR